MRSPERLGLLESILSTAYLGGIGYWLNALKKPPTIDFDVIDKGIDLITREVIKIHSDVRQIVFDAMLSNDATDIDADIADYIVQAGVFGEIIYG